MNYPGVLANNRKHDYALTLAGWGRQTDIEAASDEERAT